MSAALIGMLTNDKDEIHGPNHIRLLSRDTSKLRMKVHGWPLRISFQMQARHSNVPRTLDVYTVSNPALFSTTCVESGESNCKGPQTTSVNKFAPLIHERNCQMCYTLQ